VNECSARTETTEDKVETVTARQTAFEQEMLEGYSAQEEATNCVRYGVKEFGGFGRNASLTIEQYRHMLTQERGNFALWNQRNRADIIDSVGQQMDNQDQGEEESLTTDAENDENSRPTGMEGLLQNMCMDQNRVVAAERWHEASDIQQAICLLLDATTGPEPEGMSVRVANGIRSIFQRLYKFHRNRGQDERRDRFRLYVEDINSLMM
jgi:hypothetical protein